MNENNKYKIVNGRVVALQNFNDVVYGNIGGYVDGEHNLSHKNNCWIYYNARVFGDAKVSGNAKVTGKAKVFGDAEVGGDAEVFGDAKVSGNAEVYGKVKVFGDAEVFGDALVAGNAQVYGNATVAGNAHVYGNARVSGNAQVSGNAEVFGDALVAGSARVAGNAVVSDDIVVSDNARVYAQIERKSANKVDPASVLDLDIDYVSAIDKFDKCTGEIDLVDEENIDVVSDTDSKVTRFDLEECIMDCWHVVSDIKLISESVVDGGKSDDEISNMLIGVHSIGQLKFEKLLAVFEELVSKSKL